MVRFYFLHFFLSFWFLFYKKEIPPPFPTGRITTETGTGCYLASRKASVGENVQPIGWIYLVFFLIREMFV